MHMYHILSYMYRSCTFIFLLPWLCNGMDVTPWNHMNFGVPQEIYHLTLSCIFLNFFDFLEPKPKSFFAFFIWPIKFNEVIQNAPLIIYSRGKYVYFFKWCIFWMCKSKSWKMVWYIVFLNGLQCIIEWFRAVFIVWNMTHLSGIFDFIVFIVIYYYEIEEFIYSRGNSI